MIEAKSIKREKGAKLDKLFKELRRRNMFRVAGAYAVIGWLLMQLAVVLETSLNLPSWFDTFVTVFVLLGLPVALFFAWAFELTPEGMRPTESIPDEHSITKQTGRKLEYAIVAGLALVVGLMITDQFIAKPTPEMIAPNVETSGDASPENFASAVLNSDKPNIARVQKASTINNKSVAVLPFVNRSAVENDAFFAAGIHDDLLTQLSKMSALEVISRTSVMGYVGTEKKIPEIASELGVAVVVEGAVQRGGDRVLITVQVIDGATDSHLWAERYDRELTPANIFQIQSEITHVIAETLEAVLTRREEALFETPLTKSMAAYDHFIKGQLLTQPGTSNAEELAGAVKAYDAAIAEDPTFAAAWAGKAYAQLTRFWFLGRDKSDLASAKVSLDRAEALSPNSPETLIPLAFYNYWGLRDFKAANAAFNRAIDAAPNNSQALAGKAFISRRLGKFTEAARDLETAHRLDPLTYYLLPELALTYVLIGDFNKANEMMRRAQTLNPGSEHAALFGASVWQFQGEPGKAWDVVSAVDGGEEFRFFDQFAEYAIATRDAEKIALVKQKWPQSERYPERAPELYNIFLMRAHAALGDEAGLSKERSAMRERIQVGDAVYPEDWFANQSYSPAVIPGLLGDIKTVRRVAANYDKQDTQDELTGITYLGDIADAFVRAGDLDAAVDYLERMRDLTGPHMFLLFEDSVGLDGVRKHPRYLKLKTDYEAWAKENPSTE